MSKKRTAAPPSRAKVKPQDPPLPAASVRSKHSFLDDFYANRPKSIPVRESYPVYLLGLSLDRKDLDQLAYECLTGGPDDKDTDCCYVDTELGEAFVVQSYLADTWTKPEAPSN